MNKSCSGGRKDCKIDQNYSQVIGVFSIKHKH